MNLFQIGLFSPQNVHTIITCAHFVFETLWKKKRTTLQNFDVHKNRFQQSGIKLNFRALPKTNFVLRQIVKVSSSCRSFCRTIHLKEIWKQIMVPELDYNFSKYEISDLGRIRNLKSGKILKPDVSREYPRVGLMHDNYSKAKLKFIHSLVCAVFHGTPKGKQSEVHHKNHVKTDFRAKNLQWVSSSENKRLYSAKFPKKQKGIPVLKLNKKNEIIEIFDSIQNAAKSIGLSKDAMRHRTKTGHLYHGYRWKLNEAKTLENEKWKNCVEDEKAFSL
jgi:hypothetical protein